MDTRLRIILTVTKYEIHPARNNRDAHEGLPFISSIGVLIGLFNILQKDGIELLTLISAKDITSLGSTMD